jgi:hypothetical protein
MSYAPANNEDLGVLERRIVKSVNSSHWQKEKVFSAVGEGVALVIIPTSDALGKRESQKKLLDFFINTRELITAASYATKSFEERLGEFNREFEINIQKKDDEKSFEELFNLLSTMQRVMFAVSSVRGHLHRLGRGELMTFATDLWNFNNPVDFDVLHKNLDYVHNISSSTKSKSIYSKDIQKIANQIIQLPSPFPTNKKQNLFKV